MERRIHSQAGPPQTTVAIVKALLRFSSAYAWLLPLLVIFGLLASSVESLGISLIVLFLYSMIGRATEAAATSGIIGNAIRTARPQRGARNFAHA